MIKSTPELLAVDILERSICRVKMGAVIADRKGIFAWGWNHPGFDGFGMHAEMHAISRANPKRLDGAYIYVAGTHSKTGKFVPARPCEACAPVINNLGLNVLYYDRDDWVLMERD